MSLTDNVALARLKNRHRKSELDTEIRRIENEKQNALKMHNIEKQRFRAKYSKLNFSIESSVNNNPDVTRYKKTEEQRSILSLRDSSSILFEDIHSLLFTDGEVDIEKVLCLHLLSIHTTESLSPTTKIRHGKTSADHSPVERLLERSKRRHMEAGLTKLLPSYVIDVPGTNRKKYSRETNEDDADINMVGKGQSIPASFLIKDGRLAARLVVNEKLLHLIEAVLSALKQSNPEKMDELIDMASDVSKLKVLFRKPQIQEFLKNLKHRSLITSCESFILTPPFKDKPMHLEIKTLSGNLESVIKHIHKNVLQYPRRNTWQSMYEQGTIGSKTSDDDTIKQKRKSSSAKRQAERSTMDSEESAIYAGLRRGLSKKIDRERERRNTIESLNEKLLGKHLATNFIAKNIEAIGSVRKKSVDVEENVFSQLPPVRRNTIDSQVSAGNRRKSSTVNAPVSHRKTSTVINLNVKPTEELMHEYTHENANIMEIPSIRSGIAAISNTILRRSTANTNKRKSEDSEDLKANIKQTKCAACMARWKKQLPAPKTTINKRRSQTSDEKITDSIGLKTNSIHYISNLIEKEKFKLDSYDKRYSNDNPSTGKSNKSKPITVHKFSFDSVELSAFDLAKIKQQIRQKETQKKLEKFLTD